MTLALYALIFKLLGISGWILAGIIVGNRIGGKR